METRKCSKCKVEKQLNEYHKQKSNKSGYQAQCKKCQSAAATKHFNDNKGKRVKQIYNANALIRDRNYEFVFRWLRMFGECVDCGINDIRVLEFDHVRGEKYKGVKDMCHKTSSIKKIKHEIRKCEIRCCNCHRIKTQETLGWRTSGVPT